MRMRVIITIVSFTMLLVVGFAGNIFAKQYVWDSEDFHVDVDSANDLHITYFSDTKMRLVGYNRDGFNQFTALPLDIDSTTWECTWSRTSGYFFFCDTVRVGVQFEQEQRNTIHKRDIYWTLNGTPVGGELPGIGFELIPPENPVDTLDTLYYIAYNNTNQILEIQNLSFRISREHVPLGQMIYDSLQGFGPLQPDSILNPGDSAIFVVVPPSSREISTPITGYVMAKGIAVDITENEISHFVHQHQHPRMYPAPTLTQWGVITLLILMLLSGIVIIRRRKALVHQ